MHAKRRWLQNFSEGAAEQKDLLGGKGANLAEMTRMGLPVPPGFTVTTDACRAYLVDEALPEGLIAEVDQAVAELEAETGRRFGDPADPLLLSVRSGAKFSMPGMMDTVLDLGLNPTTVKGLAEHSGDEVFAFDSWRRFTEMFAHVVLDVPDEQLSALRRGLLARANVDDASLLDAEQAHGLIIVYRDLVEHRTGAPFPDDPHDQLVAAITAVFRSWNGKRAREYRRIEAIADDLGTAVNVQAMVFGNRGDDSGSGVVFTRNPATGEPLPYGDYLTGAQGEDVVAGVRTVEPFSAFATDFPGPHSELVAALDRLEDRYRDMCDVEFTVEDDRLWVLQTRVGKRSAAAALRIAVDMVDEGLIDEREAVRRFRPAQLDRLLHPGFDPSVDKQVLASGLGASPGAACGEVRFTADAAVEAAADGRDVILVRPETSPEDVHGISAAVGILTSRGGLVSHAAVVARGLGTPAVCGADDLEIDLLNHEFSVGSVTVRDGDMISIDGTTGEVVLGAVPVVVPEPTPELERLLAWADDVRTLGVRANADTGPDAARARAFGAEGIGLCRTEHMFLGDRLPTVQRAILARDVDERTTALQELHDLQLADFEELLVAMDGLPVTVRLLDPPLHEFLPDLLELRVREAKEGLTADEEHVLEAVEHWQEHNPMLGVRGVRLAVIEPDLYATQVQALVSAVVTLRRAGGDPQVQVMLPLTVSAAELAYVARSVRTAIDERLAQLGEELEIPIGTMIETPRAALLAGELAREAAFVSFGTNDLTQLTFGFSRDDVEGKLMPQYLSEALLPADPFASIDVDGVGQLVRTAVAAVRAVDPEVECGVCGEHGGDPESITFFDSAGLDYVSCSPFRVPIARLAAAHAALDRGT